MAIALTDQPTPSFNDTAQASTYTSGGTWTPSGDVVYALVVNSKATTPQTPTLSGNGLTWAQIQTLDYDVTGATSRRITWFRALVSSPTSGKISVAFGGVNQTGCLLAVTTATGVDISGSNGVNSVRNIVTNFSDSNGTTASVTLGQFISTNNATLFGVGVSGTVTLVKDSTTGYVLGTQQGYITPTVTGGYEWLLNADTAPNMTWTGGNHWAAIAFELVMATPTDDTFGVQFDASSTSGIQASQSSYNITHVVGSNANPIIVATVKFLASGTVSDITYNGVALVQDASATIANGNFRIERWYLVNPSTGSHTLAVTLSGSTTSTTDVASYYNVNQGSPIEAEHSTSGTSGGAGAIAVTDSITTIGIGSMAIADIVTESATMVPLSSGQCNREVLANASGSSSNDDIGAIITPASETFSWTISSGKLYAISISSLASASILTPNVNDSSSATESVTVALSASTVLLPNVFDSITLDEFIFARVYPGVQFDASSTSGYQNEQSSYSFNHTVDSQSDRILLVSVKISDTTSYQNVSSVTFNGVSLIQHAPSTIDDGATHRIERWYLLNPTIGTHSIVVTFVSATSSISDAASYFNVNQAYPIESSSTISATVQGDTLAILSIFPFSRRSMLVGDLISSEAAVENSTSPQHPRQAQAQSGYGSSYLDDVGPIANAAVVPFTFTWSGFTDESTYVASAVSLFSADELAVIVNDSIALAEFIAVTINPLYFNVFDSITLTESVTANMYLPAFVEDDITLDESITGNMYLPVFVEDDITLDESVMCTMYLPVFVEDDITLDESVSLALSNATALFINLSETIVLDDFINLTGLTPPEQPQNRGTTQLLRRYKDYGVRRGHISDNPAQDAKDEQDLEVLSDHLYVKQEFLWR